MNSCAEQKRWKCQAAGSRRKRAGDRVGDPRREGAGRSPRAERGDVESRNRLVQENLRLVYRVARQYVHRGLPLEDLVGEGNLGLIRAADGFDPGLGIQFSTYATYWIRAAISAALADTGTTIRLPVHVARMLGRWRRTERALHEVNGHSPSFEEVATAMGLDRPRQRMIAQAHQVSRVYTDEGGFGDDRTSVFRTLEGGVRPEDSLAAAEERESISRRLDRLGVTERAIIVLRYGLAGEPPMSVGQVADRLGLKAATVQRLGSLALQKLSDHRGPRGVGHGSAFGSRVG